MLRSIPAHYLLRSMETIKHTIGLVFQLVFSVAAIGTLTLFLVFLTNDSALGDNSIVKLGMNYPMSGPYKRQGLDQWRGAQIALEEINYSGGILGKKVEIICLNSRSKPDLSIDNVTRLIEHDKVAMVFGGVSSGVAIAVGDVCQSKGVVFMATITASNATTGERGHRNTFRVCYNAWMGANALSTYLNKHYKGKKYFYIVSDYTWGWSSEASIRKFSNTENTDIHKRVLTPLGAEEEIFKKTVYFAKMINPDVLVLVLFGRDMSTAIRIATLAGLKTTCQIVVPILELGLAESAGPKVMQDVIGTVDWNWQVPYAYQYDKGIAFTEKFTSRYDRYPCWGASTAYTALIQYKAAVERARSFDTQDVIKSLEGSSFTLLKDEQIWRSFDHQCVQSVFIVKCKQQVDVLRDDFKLDYFEILDKFPGHELVQSREQWENRRLKANAPPFLEKLLGE